MEKVNTVTYMTIRRRQWLTSIPVYLRDFISKSSLTMDDTFNYLSKIDINSEDLEKRTLTSKLLITGRSLLNMAKKGLKMYKKALGYAAKKWNIEKTI